MQILHANNDSDLDVSVQQTGTSPNLCDRRINYLEEPLVTFVGTQHFRVENRRQKKGIRFEH